MGTSAEVVLIARPMPDHKIDRELRTFNRLIASSLAIEAEAAKEAGQLGFMARALTQATMPHRKVDDNEFTRRNGAFTLTMQAPRAIGLPYGSTPRLLMAWLTTEAVRTRERELVLGDSMSAFMRELGYVPVSGKRGQNKVFKEQATRLFASSVSAIYRDDKRTSLVNRTIADAADLWWDPQSPDQAGLWRSTVLLSESFFKEVIERPVPVDLRVLKALKRSPLALDTYVWLTWRMSFMRDRTEIPWEALAAQFGSEYGRLRDFKAAFKAELKNVLMQYTSANVEERDAGLVLLPSSTHVRKAAKALPGSG